MSQNRALPRSAASLADRLSFITQTFDHRQLSSIGHLILDGIANHLRARMSADMNGFYGWAQLEMDSGDAVTIGLYKSRIAQVPIFLLFHLPQC